MGVEEREAAEARADPDPAAAAAPRDLVEPRGEGAGIRGRGGERLHPVGLVDEGNAVGRGGPVGDEPPQQAQEAGPPRVVAAVEDDEERAGARTDALEADRDLHSPILAISAPMRTVRKGAELADSGLYPLTDRRSLRLKG